MKRLIRYLFTRNTNRLDRKGKQLIWIALIGITAYITNKIIEILK